MIRKLNDNGVVIREAMFFNFGRKCITHLYKDGVKQILIEKKKITDVLCRLV